MSNFLKHPSGCKAIFWLILSLFGGLKGIAQLRINDVCPDVSLQTVLNNPAQSIKLSQFSGKVLIIEFWNTACLSCLQSFPNVDSLQRRFASNVQFVLVTKESKTVVESFFKKHSKIKAPDVPMVVEDQILSTLFPSDGYPYTVWLDKNRTVKYLTGGYNTTALHLDQFLSGDVLPFKYAAVKTVYAPLWSLPDSLFQKKMEYYSSITPCISGIDISGPEGEVINEGRSVQLTCNCCTAIELFKKAYRELDKYPVDTKYGMEVTLKNASSYMAPTNMEKWDEWQEHNTYNYQLVLPASKKGLLYKTMTQDLNRYFEITAFRERKKVRGFALVALNGKQPLASNGGKVTDAYNDGNVDADVLKFTNQPVERLYYLLGYWLQNYYPLKKQVSYKKNIDFIIRKTSIDPLNIAELKQDLRKANLDLKEIDLETDVLIIKEK